MELKQRINRARQEVALLLNDIRSEENDKLSSEQKDNFEKMINTALSAYEMMILKSEELQSYQLWQSGVKILQRLFEGLPLTPIKEDDFVEPEDGGLAECPRYDALYRYKDGDTTVYIDRGRFVNYNVDQDKPVFSPLVEAIAQEGFPVDMPYIPSDKRITIFYSEDAFGTDRIIGVTHFLPEGQLNPRPIGRYFKEVACDECDYEMPDGRFVEIDKEKFLALKIRIEKARKEAEEKGEN